MPARTLDPFALALCVLVLAGAAPASGMAQRRGTAFTADPPFLAPGDKVVGLSISLLCTAFGGDQCGVARWSVKAAPYTIPLGLVWGFFATRWQRVY